MSNYLSNNPEQGASRDRLSAMRRLGDGSLQRYSTNLPEGINVFDLQDGSLLNAALRPYALDSLHPGEYVAGVQKENGMETHRVIKVHEHEGMKTVTRDSFSYEPAVIPGAERIMARYGFVLSQAGDVQSIPTPETLIAAAESNGVPIELVDDEELISGERYLAIVADEGKYPVSTLSERYYMHDIQAGHLTAVDLGGGILRDKLQKTAEELLALKIEPDKAAARIDQFTESLHDVVNVEDPTEEVRAWREVYAAANILSIDFSTVETIVDQSRGKLAKLKDAA